MASTNAGIQSADLVVNVYMLKPTAEQIREKPFDYLGRMSIKVYDSSNVSSGEHECYYTVKFNKLITTRVAINGQRQNLYANIRRHIGQLLKTAPANFTLKSNGVAWVEDELWAVGHDWEQEHSWLLYYPKELSYLSKDNNAFKDRDDAVWLTYDEAIAKRNELLQMYPDEIFNPVLRADHLPTNF